MRIYGQWAGNPKGAPEDITRCIESVYRNHLSHQCERKRGKGPGGLYCGVHNPEAAKKRQERSDAAYKAKRDRQNMPLLDAVVAERERCAKLVENFSLPDAYSQPCMVELAKIIRSGK